MVAAAGRLGVLLAAPMLFVVLFGLPRFETRYGGMGTAGGCCGVWTDGGAAGMLWAYSGWGTRAVAWLPKVPAKGSGGWPLPYAFEWAKDRIAFQGYWRGEFKLVELKFPGRGRDDE